VTRDTRMSRTLITWQHACAAGLAVVVYRGVTFMMKLLPLLEGSRPRLFKVAPVVEGQVAVG